jgi:hypothetical protein
MKRGRSLGRAATVVVATAMTALGLGAVAVRAQAPAPPAPGPVAPADGKASAPAADPGGPAPANVRIVFTVLPSTKKAVVFWGKKKLGAIAPHQPLVIQRPRDSGPLDVIVRADGCVPVQTRAYTFADNKLAVKVTPLDEKNTLLGYREELPPDGGAPTASPTPDAGAR